jgi:hypothetical protein
MADLKRVKTVIQEIGCGGRKNVTADDIRWVVKHLGQNGYTVAERKTKESILFRINGRRFGICDHNPGSKHIKPCYVDEFINAMCDLDLYEN